jgi:hypothetical protein
MYLPPDITDSFPQEKQHTFDAVPPFRRTTTKDGL